MKILIIGLGSIGQRHLQNLIKINKDFEFGSITSPKKNSIILLNRKVVKKQIYQFYDKKLTYLSDKKMVKKFDPDLVLVCNYNHKHVETALSYMMQNKHIFIEKPLAINDKQLEKISKSNSNFKKISMVGFQQRFNPCINYVKKILPAKKRILSARFIWGTNLKKHRPYENYSKSYVANQKFGGGAIHSLSHELDIIVYLFGLPSKVLSFKGKSKLKINTDDNVTSTLHYKNFIIDLFLSFSYPSEKRYFSILCDNKLVECDLEKQKVTQTVNNKKSTRKFTFNRNKLFLDEMKHLIKAIENNRQTNINIREASKSVELALMMHKSMKQKKIIFR